MISLIIPATSSNQHYTDFAIQQIRELYPNEDEVEIVVEINDDVTLGINYNNAVAKAKGEVVVLMHNDMVPHPGFVETILKHIERKLVLVYHRVEPPIYTDEYPGKSILDCGRDIETYDKDKFFSYNNDDMVLEGGSQLFFAVYKDDYLDIDGYTFKKFCEDDDVHLRYKLAGYQCKVATGAMVYHFVSKTSRSDNYQEIEMMSNLAFIKKWGFRISKYNKVYKKAYTIKGNITPDLTKALDLFFTSTPKEANVIAEIDTNTFSQQDYTFLTQLNDIVAENNEIGVFELGNVKINVKSLESFEQNLIFIQK
jgi:glycosyltransferase involved in cell wall biosynthesis